jgi:hypothetical protein
MFEARLATHHRYYDYRPAVLFSGQPEWSTLYCTSITHAMADLSMHAAAYGRRMAGVKREPPPLPKRPQREQGDMRRQAPSVINLDGGAGEVDFNALGDAEPR